MEGEMMDDTYVYISVKLYLNPGQTEDSIQEIVQECDYSFAHDEIREHEIVDILDHQIPDEEEPDYEIELNNKTSNDSGYDDEDGLYIIKVDPFGLPEDYE